MKLSKEMVTAARKRLLQMHYESGVGHIGGNLSCLDAMLLTLHEYVDSDDSSSFQKDIPLGLSILHYGALDAYPMSR